MRKTVLLLLTLAAPLAAQESFSEFELFPSEEIVGQAPQAASPEADKRSLGVSGEALSVMQDIKFSSNSAGTFDSSFIGNLMLDARLKRGVKAFANVEAVYSPDTRSTEAELREAFLDFNLDGKVYFRTGKQVLQWGRCYLWNPTDLVNAEKKPFTRKLGYRDGAYGLKAHMPFGAKYNIYAFLDTGNAAEDRDLSGALKFEFVAGRTEMAFSGWGARERHPVFGYDLSSRLGRFDLAAEVSASRRDNARYLRAAGGTLETYRKDARWPLRAAVNFGRGFRLGEFNDRLRLTAEYFHNANGYGREEFRDKALYAFSGPAAAALPAGTRAAYLAASGLYEPNYLSRNYGALFATVSRFLITDMTLNLNYLRNLTDDSGIVSASVSYKDINDFSAGLLVNSYVGPGYGEYTAPGARLLVQLTAGVSF